MSEYNEEFPYYIIYPPDPIVLPAGLWNVELYSGGDDYTVSIMLPLPIAGPLEVPYAGIFGPEGFIIVTELI